MRITILVNRDPASAYALTLLKPELEQHQLKVFYTDKPSRRKPIPRALVDLAVFEKVQLSRLSSIFLELDAERLNDINGNDFSRFAQCNPELVISIRHMSILQPKVIGLAEKGVINLHSGLLPSYQGVMATFWAMKNRETEIGTSLHWIEDANIDTGSLIEQSCAATRFDKSYFWNVLNIYREGCTNICSAINTLSTSQQVTSTPQYGSANYYSYPNQEDLDKFEPTLFEQNDLDFFLSLDRRTIIALRQDATQQH